MGRARKSIGQVTLTTIGGVCVGRQKVGENKSNTNAQRQWRYDFASAMKSAAWLVPLANDAYARKGLKTAWSRMCKYLMAAALDADYEFARPAGEIAYRIQGSYGDFPMSEGSLKANNVQYLNVTTHNLLVLTFNKNVYTEFNLRSEDRLNINVDWFINEHYYHNDRYDSPITYHGHPTEVGVYDNDFNFVVALEMPLLSAESTAQNYLKGMWPVLRLNGKRIGLRAWDYFDSLA